ncbi:hypothetical protein ACQUY5_29260 [Bacillus cereus]|uniref:hypothetical protein n=1 Tax=Bacillus cereus TaxID=1396 RepID=UPI003D185E76
MVLDFVTNGKIVQTHLNLKMNPKKFIKVGVCRDSKTVLFSYLELADRCNFINPSIICVLLARKVIIMEEQTVDGQTILLKYSY